MANISSFRKEIAPTVIGCPGFLIDRAVVKTIIRFCRKTNRLQEGFEHTVLSTDVDTADNDSVEVDLSTYLTSQVPVRMVKFAVDGFKYDTLEMKLSTDVTNLSSILDPSKRYFTFTDSTHIKLFPFTAVDMKFFIRLSVQPVRTITTIDDFIYDEFLEAIEEGAKWLLLKDPGKVWTNKDDARKSKREFLRACEKAAIDVNRSQSQANMVVNDAFF